MPPPDPVRLAVGGRGRPGLAELFAALPLATVLVDPDDRVAHANAAAEQLLNVSERLMLGQALAAVLTLPPDRAEGGGSVAVYDADVRTPRGGRLRLDLTETALPDHPGWRVLTLRDVGGPRRLGQGADRAGGGRAAYGAAAMLAHEIKNPLSGIRGAAQLMGPGELPRLITAEVDRVAALIDRMQDFTDTRPLPCSPENIYPLLAHARGLALAGFARGFRVEERYDPSLPPAMVNRDALLQVVINLLKNACEAIRDVRDGDVTLVTAYRHGVGIRHAAGGPPSPLPIEIAVTDNGPGAPPDIADQLFDPFVSGRPEGTGLGLALAGKLVRDMGGLIQYAREGAPPRTVFRLLLPRAAS